MTAKRNSTGLHVPTKLQQARESAGHRKLAAGGQVAPSSYNPAQFQPAALLPIVPESATQAPDPSSNLALLSALKVGTPLVKNVLGLTGGSGGSNSLGIGSSVDNFLAGGMGPGGEVTDGLLGSGGRLFGTVNPETGLPVGGIGVGNVGTGLGGLGGIAGGIMGLTNAGSQNGIGIAGDVAQLGGGAAALGSTLGLVGAAGGPIGLALAGVGALASSLFGNKKPHNISGLVINSVGGDGSLAPLAVGNDNGANTGQLQDLLSKVAQPYLQTLGTQYGIDLSGVNIGAFAHQTEGKGDFTMGFTGPVPGQSFAIDPNNIAATTPQALQQLGQAMLASWQQMHPDQKLTPIDAPAGGGGAAQLPPKPEPKLVTADDIRTLYGRKDGGPVFDGLMQGPGTPTSDSIATRLAEGGKGPMVSRDEFVVNAHTVQRFGPDFFYGLQQLARQPSVTPEEIRALFQETKMGFPTEGQSRYHGINRTRLGPSRRAAIVLQPAPAPIEAPIGMAPVARRAPVMPPISADDLKGLYVGPHMPGPAPRAPLPHLARGGAIRRHLDGGGEVAANPAAGAPGGSIYSAFWNGDPAFNGGASTSGMQGTQQGIRGYSDNPNINTLVGAELAGGGGNVSLGVIDKLANAAGLMQPDGSPFGNTHSTDQAGYTIDTGGTKMGDGSDQTKTTTTQQQPGITIDQVSDLFDQKLAQALAQQQKTQLGNNAVASSFSDPTTGALVKQQGPAQNAIQVLNALSPARANRFASEYQAPTFWG